MSFDAGGISMGELDQGGEVSENGRGRERRATYRALAYWEKLCSAGQLPSVTNFGADAPADLRPALFMVSMRRPAETSLISGAGAALEELCGKPAAGKTLADAMPIGLRETLADLTRVIDTYRKPVLNSGMTQTGGGRTVMYRSVLMPLSDAAGQVTGYLGAIGSRQLPAMA